MRASFYVVTIMLVIMVVLYLSLNIRLDSVKKNNTDLIDQYLDISEKYTECQMENTVLLDEVLSLEEENQILGSYAASQAIKD
tara:strand:- start:4526 stop:4774 length:249 start_codon:yes stop_codon:yes gene_type:complete